MIRAKINQEFPHHNITKHTGDIYVADYSNKTKYSKVKRNVEIFSSSIKLKIIYFIKKIGLFNIFNRIFDFNYIETFNIYNLNKMEVGTIIFDNNSFKYPNGNTKSQCEVCLFPFQSNNESWILFSELKYGCNEDNNESDFTKAIKQLYKTRHYYKDKNIFSKTNNCYLIISMPKQTEPFLNFILTSDRVDDLKEKHNIILRAKNSVKILDDKMLDLT